MGRMYTGSFQNVSVVALQDLFELTAADDEPIKLHAVFVSQGSDMGDAEEEGLRVAIIRGNTTSGSGGTAGTEEPIDPKTGAASALLELNNTTEASAGTEAVLYEEQMNSRSGVQFVPTPEFQPKTDQGAGLIVVRLLTVPNDALLMSGSIYWEEG